jgi:hypothetical protein
MASVMMPACRRFVRSQLPWLCANAAPCACRCGGLLNFACTQRRLRLTGLASSGDDELDPTLLHTPQSQKTAGDVLQAVGSATHDENLKAQVAVDVNVQHGANLFAELILNLGQPFTETALAVVVNQRERSDGVNGLAHLGSPDLCSGQVPEQLGSRAPALAYESIEIA